MDNLEKIREFFKNDLFATEATGVVIEEAGPGYARCSMPIERIHRNAMGGVMGGAIFTLADFTFAIAANVDSAPTVSVSGQITYLGTAKGSRLIAEARCLHAGRSGCAFTIDIKDDLDNGVASVTFYGFRKNGDPMITTE
ncbi:MAG: PaaI family thioesterase [Oscillospiraceae bacterium]